MNLFSNSGCIVKSKHPVWDLPCTSVLDDFHGKGEQVSSGGGVAMVKIAIIMEGNPSAVFWSLSSLDHKPTHLCNMFSM